MRPKALLVSLRVPSDPMAAHERRCFAERARLPIDSLAVHHMTEGRPSRDLLRRHDVAFFGGSGAYSVLDDVGWIKDGLATLLDVVELQVPAWASCFGFQGLSLAMGGEVVADAERQELGSVQLSLTDAGRDDPILSILPRTFYAQQGHHDHVDGLPRGVTLLATGAAIPHQAFKVDGAPFWASQFHPELTARTTLDRYLYYRSLYSRDADADAELARMESGLDTPEMAEVLPRLVALA
jgi:GMP synthase (glutamine-hydrolysing)